MASTFTWNPDVGAVEQRKPRIRKAQFGDGYTQRAADGLNSNLAVWQLTFSNRLQSEADAIVNFLNTQGGTTAFNWTPPSPSGGSALLFVCEEWSRPVNGYPVQTVTAKFIQVPA